MDGVATTVRAWLDDGGDPVLVRAPLTQGLGGVGPGEVLAAGAVPGAVDAIRGPVGLDLGATTPAEVAVSIVAEVLATLTGRIPMPLQATSGAIHR